MTLTFPCQHQRRLLNGKWEVLTSTLQLDVKKNQLSWPIDDGFWGH